MPAPPLLLGAPLFELRRMLPQQAWVRIAAGSPDARRFETEFDTAVRKWLRTSERPHEALGYLLPRLTIETLA